MEQHALLITGFEPFHKQTINPSWEAVAFLPDSLGPWVLKKALLPVEFGQAADKAIELARKFQPEVVLCVGQAGGREAVTPEVVAINLQEASIPDNAGNQPQGVAIDPSGWDGYFATVPVRNMVQAGQAKGLACRLSYSAGTYVCNDLFYRLLFHFKGTSTRVGFIHVPFLPEQAGEGQPSMALLEMTDALTEMILAIEP